MANCTNLRVFAGCSGEGKPSPLRAGLPLNTAIVITMAKIARAVPRCAVMICGGSFQRTVSPPRPIWAAQAGVGGKNCATERDQKIGNDSRCPCYAAYELHIRTPD